ncbi:MAG: phosphoribosylformylglycinamidine synthase subunit PurQ [Bdellovibrionota bacterium]
MRIGVVRFPGTNCDADVFQMVENSSHEPVWLWHQDRFDVKSVDSVIIPGGFSYGDYLRCGALASRSAVMKSVSEFAEQGRPVLGICNGFQILCESGLLPGVLLRNESVKFIDDWVELSVENGNEYFAKKIPVKKRFCLPIAHGEGRYFAPPEELKKIQDKGQVWLSYVKNPNGSLKDIAGLMNEKKNVFGLMPHPERAMQSWMGGTDGGLFL